MKKWMKWAAIGLIFASSVSLKIFTQNGVTQEENTLPDRSVANHQKQNEFFQKLPPLIERHLFFGNPKISGAQLSPNGEFIAFKKPLDDVMNVWVKRLDEPFEAARPITNETNRPVPRYAWSADGQYLIYAQDKGGNENFHIYAVDPTSPSVSGSSAPPARDLTPFENVKANLIAVPENQPNYIIVGLNDRNPKLHDVYRINLSTGERELLIKNDRNIAGWLADREGNVRIAVRQTSDGGTEILRVEGDSFIPIYTCSFEETCSPVRFHKDGDRFYLRTNKGEDADLIRLVLFDPDTKESELIAVDPEGKVDLGATVFSEATDELVATIYFDDRQRIYARDEDFASDLVFLQQSLPDGNFSFDFPENSDRLLLVSVERDIDPGSTYLYNRETRQIEKLYESRPDLPSEHLAPMLGIRYKAHDGVEIPAYLTIPKGVEPLNLPLVVVPHGGPWARDLWGYDAYAQFLANRGYAVLQPNFRGSTGYGKRFLNAGNEEWGTGVMQNDLTDGVRYAIDRGIADPDRVAIFGGSYGGYAALAGLAFTPELYAAGISFVGPSNLITLINSIPPYWEPIEQSYLRRVGDPEDPQDRDRLRRQSPLFSAKQIEAPLMVIQGANDPRVKKAESDQIVVAMRELGRDVKYLVAPNEGHGFRREDNRLAVSAAIERFLARHLGGRAQEAIAPEIQERLEALTVDVNTVTAPQAISETSDSP